MESTLRSNRRILITSKTKLLAFVKPQLSSEKSEKSNYVTKPMDWKCATEMLIMEEEDFLKQPSISAKRAAFRRSGDLSTNEYRSVGCKPCLLLNSAAKCNCCTGHVSLEHHSCRPNVIRLNQNQFLSTSTCQNT